MCSALCQYLEECESHAFEDEFDSTMECRSECVADYHDEGQGGGECESEWLHYSQCVYLAATGDCDLGDAHEQCEDEYEVATDCGEGSGPGTACMQAFDIFMDAYADACSGFLGECCFCDCIVNGSSSVADCDCSDYPFEPPSECSESDEEFAQQCIDDPASCTEGIDEMVEMVCTM
jgi:hypothetical protein